jgi:hypothetical protein
VDTVSEDSAAVAEPEAEAAQEAAPAPASGLRVDIEVRAIAGGWSIVERVGKRIRYHAFRPSLTDAQRAAGTLADACERRGEQVEAVLDMGR